MKKNTHIGRACRGFLLYITIFIGWTVSGTLVFPNFSHGRTIFESYWQSSESPYPLSVALGDVDSDGDLDAWAANRLWLNDGRGEFSDSGQDLGSGQSSNSVALGDVDDDGDLDAWVANGFFGGEANRLWLNDGRGNFSDCGQVLGGGMSYSVALGDVDGDGDLDAWVANGAYPGQNNLVWLNDGSGVFTDSGQRLGECESRSVALGDVDGDGDLDAFVANIDCANLVWLNDGSGVFIHSGQYLGRSQSHSVALGDLDGDGDLDAWVAEGTWFDRTGSPIRTYDDVVYLNDGRGVFSDSGQDLGNRHSYSVVLGDVDGDGDLDAWVANFSIADLPSFPGVYPSPDHVWHNDGRGVFTDSGQTLGNRYSESMTLGNNYRKSVALGDLDGDGDLDAWVAKYFWYRENSNQVWRNKLVSLVPWLQFLLHEE
ncbi:MAG: FG-GAP-like repeat-containing protein [Desulfobacterales bacterium]|nr:FG-GAP-like repeat-containing protein [Desulfobacterales bacterium]